MFLKQRYANRLPNGPHVAPTPVLHSDPFRQLVINFSNETLWVKSLNMFIIVSKYSFLNFNQMWTDRAISSDEGFFHFRLVLFFDQNIFPWTILRCWWFSSKQDRPFLRPSTRNNNSNYSKFHPVFSLFFFSPVFDAPISITPNPPLIIYTWSIIIYLSHRRLSGCFLDLVYCFNRLLLATHVLICFYMLRKKIFNK